jgi:hypothetical protein
MRPVRKTLAMLPTPYSKSWEMAIDIFGVDGRACREPQERIVDYLGDGRPVFMWEAMRQELAFHGNTTILGFCEPCPLSVFGGLEGCRGPIANLDILFRALNELVPDSPWNEVPVDGSPIYPDQLRDLALSLRWTKQQLHKHNWPIAQPRMFGVTYGEGDFDPEARPQFYGWDGQGPPSLLDFNDGYQVFLSRHGLLVKATHGTPIPHTFSKMWREERGFFGLSSNGETVGFPVTRGSYPSWGLPNEVGAELVMESVPADDAFVEEFEILEVFVELANQLDTGLLIQSEPK